MKVNKKAESLVGIIIGIFILSFVVIGIGTLIGSSKDLIRDFDMKMDLDLLTTSSDSVINNIDVSNLLDGQIFYLHKNESNPDKTKWTFDIYIGGSNSEYQYIDKYGYKVNDTSNFKGYVYSRVFKVTKVTYKGEENTIIKSIIKRIN